VTTTSSRFQAARAARARSVAAACTADILIHLVPLGQNRRVKISGFGKAADIAARGISAAVSAPMIVPCPHCGRRTNKPEGHRQNCVTAVATASQAAPCSDCGRRTRKTLGHARGCIIREGYGE